MRKSWKTVGYTIIGILAVLSVVFYFLLFRTIGQGLQILQKNLESSEGKFATLVMKDVVARWDPQRIVPYMAPGYSVSWTDNLRRDIDNLNRTPADRAAFDRVFAMGAQRLGPMPQELLAICVRQDGLIFCQSQPAFAAGQARLGLFLKDVPWPGGQARYQITSLVVEYPYRPK